MNSNTLGRSASAMGSLLVASSSSNSCSRSSNECEKFGKLEQLRAISHDFPCIVAQIASNQLTQNLMQIDLVKMSNFFADWTFIRWVCTYRLFEYAKWQWKMWARITGIVDGVIFDAQNDGIFKEDGQRIHFQCKRQHDAFRHKRVSTAISTVCSPGKDWQPNAHPIIATIKPQRFHEMCFLRIGYNSIGNKKRAWKSLKQILAIERTLQWPDNAITCELNCIC